MKITFTDILGTVLALQLVVVLFAGCSQDNPKPDLDSVSPVNSSEQQGKNFYNYPKGTDDPDTPEDERYMGTVD